MNGYGVAAKALAILAGDGIAWLLTLTGMRPLLACALAAVLIVGSFNLGNWLCDRAE
ncbi:hypothetical protein [Acidihalobacter prosperus]|uniref:Uncharacterized protein n=1 Tax=Acidihalobacter prosperus TaxID=160660 RepID=A0A1A6C8C6_9GAMM|nr:hypothetical protein [Acidihalobacter prosperus]OBS10799.1 hypothetical protein Thpro_020515 [Acidihalobacter prosperus]